MISWLRAYQLVACLLSAFISLGSAHAQTGRLPDLRTESILDDLNRRLVIERLGLSGRQVDQVLIAIDGYVQWHADVARQIREEGNEIDERQQRIQELMAQGDGAQIKDIGTERQKTKGDLNDLLRRATATADEIVLRQEDTLSSILEMLSPFQGQEFIAMVRDVRREETLAWHAKYPFEHLDLIDLFLNSDKLLPDEAESITPAMHQYAQDLDLALLRRNQYVRNEVRADEEERSSPTPLELDVTNHRITVEEFQQRRAENDVYRMERHIRRLRESMAAHEQVARVNRSWFEQCLPMLSERTRSSIEREVWRRVYVDDQVEETLAIDVFIDSVLSLQSLGSGQREYVVAVRDEEWWPKRRLIEAELVRNADARAKEWEEVERSGHSKLAQNRSELWRRRKDLEAKLVSMIVEVLNDAQREEIDIPTF